MEPQSQEIECAIILPNFKSHGVETGNLLCASCHRHSDPRNSRGKLHPPPLSLRNFDLRCQACFDKYMEDKPRVFRAMFPDKRRSFQLNENEWRVQMLPINFLFLSAKPVVDLRIRYKAGGEDYPARVPKDVSKVLELDITRWELQGLEEVVKPSEFSIGLKGFLYPDRRGVRTRLRGDLELKLDLVVPPALALVPDDVNRNIAEGVLIRIAENMKRQVDSSLFADYTDFKRMTAQSKLTSNF